MQRLRAIQIAVSAVMLLGESARIIAEPLYTFTTIGPGVAQAINNNGQIVGFFSGPHGFVYAGGNFQTVDYPGSFSTYLTGINDNGAIVGNYFFNGIEYGFLYSNNTFTTLNTPPGSVPGSSAWGINNSGEIVGSIYRAGDVGFVYSGGAYTLMTGVIPYGINDVHQAVGYLPDLSGHNQGVLLSGGTLTPINFPGAYGTIAYGINRLGQISGTYTNYIDGVFSDHGFVYSEGVFTTVDYATVDYTGYNTHIYGINDYGQVVGYYTLSGDAGPIASFVASPIAPEPRTVSVVTGSLLILIAMLMARNCQRGRHRPDTQHSRSSGDEFPEDALGSAHLLSTCIHETGPNH